MRNYNRTTGEVLSRFEQVYYLDGNVRSVTETMGGVVRTVTHRYDSGGRLVTRAYNFDMCGNRTRMIVTVRETYTVEYVYDMNDRLLRETRTGTEAGVTTYTYDRNSNQLTRFVSVTPPSVSTSSVLTLGLYTPGNAPEPVTSERSDAGRWDN